MIKNFDEVSEVEFLTYLEDIRLRLMKEAPEWHVNVQTVSVPSPRFFYHLARFDFSKGKDQTWPVELRENIFAYEVLADELPGDSTFFILNQHPMSKKE